MKEKILNIKNILRIIISILVIFSMFKSCAKAWTYDEFIQFCVQNVDKETNTDLKNAVTKFISQANGVKSYATSSGFSVDNYDNFVILAGESTYQKYYLMMFNGSPTYNCGTGYIQTYGTWKYITRQEGGGANFYTNGNRGDGTQTGRKPFGLLTTAPTNGFPNGVILQNYYVPPIPPFEYGAYYDKIISVGNINEVNARKQTYNNSSWFLGTILEPRRIYKNNSNYKW